MFITKEDLFELTGCASNVGIKHFLDENNIMHAVNPSGDIIVSETKIPVIIKAIERQKHPIFLSEGDIVFSEKTRRIQTGIYFLIHKNKIVYVGQSTNFYLRIAAHVASDKEFDYIKFMPLDAGLLSIYEQEYIKRFSPKYNIVHSKPEKTVFRKKNAPQENTELQQAE